MKKWIGISMLMVLLVTVIIGMSIQGNMGADDFTEGSETGENVTIAPEPDEESFADPPGAEPEQVEAVEVSTLKIVSVGDLMFHMPQINAARGSDGLFDFNPPFKYVFERIQNADLAIANLETVIAGDHKGFSGFPRFNSPEAVLDAIAGTGFDLLVTSNNHSLDGGKEGIINIIDEVTDRGMEYIGTSKDLRRPYVVIDKNNIKLGILSYTYGLNGLDSLLTREERENMVNLIDRDLIREDILSVKEEEVDLVIAYMHWGNEYHSKSSQGQRELAEFLNHNGVDIVLGTHPHVIQEVEYISSETKKTLVVYSMGNFISNQRYDTMGVSATEDGMLVEIDVVKTLPDGPTYLSNVKFVPSWIQRVWQGNAYSYRILPVEAAIAGDIDLELDPVTRDRLEKSLSDTINRLHN
ncbi:CapA family protein [Gudongella sp. SC589]|uniref:CapA family protein n=1 Tax=Gudongella sp. SC589 TaxID=3385990 RepID=UPI0039046CCC